MCIGCTSRNRHKTNLLHFLGKLGFKEAYRLDWAITIHDHPTRDKGWSWWGLYD